jgi:hypothetical protein
MDGKKKTQLNQHHINPQRRRQSGNTENGEAKEGLNIKGGENHQTPRRESLDGQREAK